MTKEHSLGELYYQYTLLVSKYDTLLGEHESLQENYRSLEQILLQQQKQNADEDS